MGRSHPSIFLSLFLSLSVSLSLSLYLSLYGYKLKDFKYVYLNPRPDSCLGLFRVDSRGDGVGGVVFRCGY